ncbi:hypothetical protein [Enterocloster citroniae]|uniref:hypothetical protein n=1 Tax=Enterocloster citroniae TaxID=358743 RepID=UPI00349ECAB5
MKANSVRLTPLTPEEQQFAADHYDVIKWCMYVLNLREDDSDIASLGYLQAVKKWYARPDLHQYSFKTIAKWSVFHKVHNARCKEKKVRSLQESVSGAGRLAYGDAITYDNMAYLTDAGRISINTTPILPDRGGKKSQSPEINAIEEFLSCPAQNMCLEYDTKQEAERRNGVIAYYRSRMGHWDAYVVTRRQNRIYIIKSEWSRQG